jgi:gentisate 1,2-dioxygenase
VTARAGTSRDYEGLFDRWEELYKRAHYGKLHIKSTDVPIVDSRQGTSQFYIMPQFEELALTQWVVFLRDHTGVPSGRHRHQGGITIFSVEGTGYSIVNGHRFDWRSEDAVLLPIVPGGLDHQHFGPPDGGPSKFIGIIYEPLVVALGAEMVQLEPQTKDAQWEPAKTGAAAPKDGVMAPSGPTLAALIEQRERQRRTLHPPALFRRDDLPVDRGGFGELRWYVHPGVPGFAGTAPMLVFTQRLDPGQETDVLTTPGNGFLFVISGDPTVTVDDESFACGKRDIVCLPPRRNGISLSMRAGKQESRVVIALANMAGLVGYAMGADLALTPRR